MIEFRLMAERDIPGVAALQSLAFPPPFPADHLWTAQDLATHINLFPSAQWVALAGGQVVGSCSNTRIGEERWQAFEDWETTTGGTSLGTFDPDGTTLYGLDISVHPDFRRQGIGRGFYGQRFQLAHLLGMARFGTGCRLLDFSDSGIAEPNQYVQSVLNQKRTDRILTPLLSYGLNFIMTVENYWDDAESGNAAAILEWNP